MRRPHFVPTALPQTEILLERRPMIDSLVFTLPFTILDQSERIVADTSPYNSRLALLIAAPYGNYSYTDPQAYSALNRLGSIAGLNTVTIQDEAPSYTRLVTEGGDEIDVMDTVWKMAASRLPIIGRKNIKFYTRTLLDKTPL